MPISFYQDVQQEGFWSVIVRQFGNSIFRYRAVKEGFRISYKVIDPAKGKAKGSYSVRFTEEDALKVLIGPFKSQVEGLRAAINLSPEERKAMEFGQKLLISSEMQDAFWSDSKQQNDNVQEIINLIGNAARHANTPYHIRQTFLAILKFTQQAITNHERIIAETTRQESANKFVYTDRRANLLKWNERTRMFLRQLNTADAQKNLNIDAEALRMELCRMALWNPKDTITQIGNNWFEILTLQHARQALSLGNLAQCRNYCTRLLQEDWISMFADCASKSILFCLDKDVFDGWADRSTELDCVMARLDNLRIASPAYWQDEVVALHTEVAGLISTRATPMQLSFP